MTEGCEDDHQERFSLWLDGRLLPEQAELMAQHVAECPDCQTFYSALRRLEALFGEAGMPAPRPGFSARLQARLAARQVRHHT